MRTSRSPFIGSLLGKSALALTSALLLAPAAWAQQASGIAGVVRDTTGAVLPGVSVEASSPALIEKVRTVVTDGAGLYNIVELRPGTYTVTFGLSGFNTVKREGIELTTGFTATVNVDLRVGAIEETITVAGETPIVDTRNISQQAVVTRDLIDALPTGKLWSNLGALIPGISVWTNMGGQDSGGAVGNDGERLIIHGSYTSDALLRIDGMPVSMMDGSGSPAVGTPSDGMTQETVLSVGNHIAEVETGGVAVNIIPRSGGNVFSGGLSSSFAHEDLQWNNVTDGQKAQGLPIVGIKHNTDFNPTLGGPVALDRLWFYGSYRDRRSVRYSPRFPDTNDTDWVYTPDTSKGPVPDQHLNWDISGRATWQASARHRLSVGVTVADDCWCEHFLGNPGLTLAATNYSHWPNKYTQVSWTSPVSNRLLLEAAGQLAYAGWRGEPQSSAVAPAAIEQSTGFLFRSATTAGGYQNTVYHNHFARFSASYVTGTHSIKVGTTLFPGFHGTYQYALGDYSVTLLNGRPVAANYLPHPYQTDSYVFKGAVFAQDQWTLKRLTMNLGVRFDSLDTHYPDYSVAATNILPARSYPGSDVLRWRDLSPRVGLAYDLFGNGKTAVKASLSRYVAAETTGVTRSVDPTRSVGNLTRSWGDSNGDFVPQGDPLNPSPNGEIGPSPNANYGVPRFALRLDPELAQGGLGSRGYNWEASTSIQHELMPRVSANLAYFRRSYGNFLLTDNLAVAPTDYDEFCVTAPRDARLPGSGGQRICGLFDLKRERVGQVDNLRTYARNYGDQFEYHNSVDVTLDARLPQGVLLQGGLSTTKSVSDNCDVVTKVDNPSTLYCHAETPFLSQWKFHGTYTLPWALQIAATYKNTPGTGIPDGIGSATTGVRGLRAIYVATNAEIAPSLGRPLSSSTFVTVPLIAPGEEYLDRVQQLDVRVGRTFATGRVRTKAMIDLYNVFNASTVVLVTDTYGTTGAAWLRPEQILLGRYAKLGVQLSF
jgi:hypothetical protein